MVSGCLRASVAALSLGGVGAFHVPVLPSTRRAGAVGRATSTRSHVSGTMSAGDDMSFYPFQRTSMPSARCVSMPNTAAACLF